MTGYVQGHAWDRSCDWLLAGDMCGRDYDRPCLKKDLMIGLTPDIFWEGSSADVCVK